MESDGCDPLAGPTLDRDGDRFLFVAAAGAGDLWRRARTLRSIRVSTLGKEPGSQAHSRPAHRCGLAIRCPEIGGAGTSGRGPLPIAVSARQPGPRVATIPHDGASEFARNSDGRLG